MGVESRMVDVDDGGEGVESATEDAERYDGSRVHVASSPLPMAFFMMPS